MRPKTIEKRLGYLWLAIYSTGNYRLPIKDRPTKTNLTNWLSGADARGLFNPLIESCFETQLKKPFPGREFVQCHFAAVVNVPVNLSAEGAYRTSMVDVADKLSRHKYGPPIYTALTDNELGISDYSPLYLPPEQKRKLPNMPITDEEKKTIIKRWPVLVRYLKECDYNLAHQLHQIANNP